MSEFIQGRVGEKAFHAITQIRDEAGEPATGNVLRKLCEFAGAEACKGTCQLELRFGEGEPLDSHAQERYSAAAEQRSCADLNVKMALEELGLPAKEVWIIAANKDDVGFADELEDYKERGKFKVNSQGWHELDGFNAFFAREGEITAFGRRMGDCPDIDFEFKDKDGNTIFGFEHATRTNMFGSSEYRFERDGRKVSYTEYVLGQALDHYGADPTSVSIKLAAAIKAENNTGWSFASIDIMEEKMPGWFEDGHLVNVTNPRWQPADGFLDKNDNWKADTRGMIISDLLDAMRKLGVPLENLSTEGIIDPNEDSHKFSSYKAFTSGKVSKNTRDLYLTYIPRD
jgi:hypothetical protein